jgi:4-amino-4-deoxy-L-arabinose transferase-like glycosyltransferase
MEKIFQTTENKILAFLSIGLALNTLFFIAREVDSLSFLIISQNTHFFYFIYASLLICFTGTFFFYVKGVWFQEWYAKKLLVYFPTIFLLAFALTQSKHFHYIFQIIVGLYIVSVGFFLIDLYHRRTKSSSLTSRLSCKQWFVEQTKPILVILAILVVVNLSFGTYRIAQFAAVDEALWTFGGRIAKYWTNIADRDWNGTKVSDKPGVTVSIVSGAGLLFETPKNYKPIKWEGNTYHPKNDIQKLNFALRFPILLFTVLMLPIFYFFLERLFGSKKALISTILIGTSPILLGMSRIINPDSLLWIFAPLSLISYFVFLKRKAFAYLYWSGIFLGLALLTKYVANIVFVFFFGLIFLEYILMNKKDRLALDFITYIKKSFIHYLILTFIALAVFYLLYPAVWVKPTRLLEATLLSQAFSSTWPIFIGIISFIFIDQWTMKNKITKAILDTLADKKHWLIAFISGIFLFSILFALLNTLTGMHWYDFEAILASPKSSYAITGFLGIFLGNFYPLIFGIHPLACIALVIFSIFLIRHANIPSPTYQSGLYLIVFILLYYLGTTVNHVATISRYQIMLFPATLILAGIALTIALEILLAKIQRVSFAASSFVLLLITTMSLWFSVPLYSGYASALLPKTYHIDIKDMGDGSYEAAAFLNTLPDAKHITVWSDKNGVCTFFVGNCYGSFNYNNLITKNIQYVVVSSGRQSRTTKMVQGSVANLKPNVIRFDQYYDQTDNLSWSLSIDNRPGNFVKVIPFVK